MSHSDAQAARQLKLPVAIAIGAAAGALSGLFGVGGGILIMPALILIGRLPHRLAYGTSLVAVAPIALLGLTGFLLDGKVDWPVVGLLAAGAMIGAAVGTKLGSSIPRRLLVLSFVALLAFAAVQLFVHDPASAGRDALDVVAGAELVGLGLLAGVLAGLLGIGGGVIIVPATILIVGLEPAVAKGSALAVMVPTALTGTYNNVRNRVADLRAGAILGLSGGVTSFVASRVSVGLDPEISNILFAGLLIAVGTRLLISELRSPADAT